MSAYVLVPLAVVVLAVVASFFVPPDRLGTVPLFVVLGILSLALFYLAIYCWLSLPPRHLRPLEKAAWALGLPAGLALLLAPLSYRDSRTGLGFVRFDMPVLFVLTLPAQVVLTPGFRYAREADEERRAQRTPDPCGADVLTLDATGMFEASVRDVALQPDGGVLLLLELEGVRTRGLRLVRFLPDGRLDPKFAFNQRCLPDGLTQLEVAPAGEVLVYGRGLLEPLERDTARALLLSPDGAVVRSLEAAPEEGRAAMRFDAAGSLWALSAASSEGPVLLEEVWSPREGAEQRRRDLRPLLGALGPVCVKDFFFWSNGDVGLLGDVAGPGVRYVLLRVGAAGRVSLSERPVGPSRFRGLLEGDRLLLAENWVYAFRADVVGSDGSEGASPMSSLKPVLQPVAASALGRWFVVAGYPPRPGDGGSPKAFRLVLLDSEGRVVPSFSVRRS